MLLKQNFIKHFVPQQELSDEQALHPNTDQFASSPVQIEAPLELLKIMPNALTEGEWGFEHTKAVFQKEIIPLLRTLKDIFNVFDKDLLNESVEITNLNAQLQEKVFFITALKNDHRKVKGKDIVDNVSQVSNATTIAPGMYKLDPVILAPKVKNNREAHEYYLKHTMEQAAILRELLCYVRDTCPSNIPKETNRPLSSSTGVNPSTSTSESKPLGNIKNDRIPQTPNSNEKNKAKVQSRKVESCLNKRNFDFKNVCNELVKHLVKGSKALCSICNECLFDANHDICIIDHVNSTSQGSDTSVAPSSSSLIDC
ncbi:hypothetical protein Tco_1423739, partial [Tanacetum coccineum]